MAQQISIEAALDGYRRRAVDQFHANVLLEARVAELEAEVASLRSQELPSDPTVEPQPGIGEYAYPQV